MIVLLILLLTGAYLGISVAVVFWAKAVATKNGSSPWVWGITAAIGMYLLVFWDLIPVLVMHHRYCSSDSGVWVFETPERWAKNHPEALRESATDQRSLTHRTEQLPDGWRVWLTDKLYSESNFDRHFSHAIRRHEQRLVDARNGQILVKEVDYERGSAGAIELGAESLTDLKFWLAMGNNTCGASEAEYPKKYVSVVREFEGLLSRHNPR